MDACRGGGAFFAPSSTLPPNVWCLLSKSLRICSSPYLYLGLPEGFSKKFTYACSSVINERFPGEKPHLIPHTAMLRPKNIVVLPNVSHFLEKYFERQPFWDETRFLSRNHCSTQNYVVQSKVSLFDKNVWQAKIWGSFCRPLRTKSIKMVPFRGHICKIGARYCPPPFHLLY